MALLVGFFNVYSQVTPERMSSKLHYERCACYFFFNNQEYVISIVYDVIEKSIYSKEMFVIKSRTNEYVWKVASDVLFTSEIYGDSGDRLDIHQSWGDKNFKQKTITNPKINYGGNANVTIIDSTYIIFTTVLFLKETKNNIPSYYPYPISYLLKYDKINKYWNLVQYKTFSMKQYETLVVQKINDEKYRLYNTIESAYVVMENNNFKIID